ncbi:MAG: enzyme of heme biosynthesis, partial [Alistipes sp.]|nr:enzyme of heme biosynthesis [Alistipes sp.]
MKLILAVAFAAMGISAMAQEINYDDPKYAVWGENADERRDNMLNNQFLKEAVDNKNYSAASKYLNILLTKCPAASQNIYTNGAKLYKNLINKAEDEAGKKVYIDSLMYLYDVRLKAFEKHKKYGKDYILNRKAREFYSYFPDDREGIRKIFQEAVEASNEMKGKYDLELVGIYFAELCADYENDIISAEDLIAAYDRYSPAFDGVEEEADIELKNQFDSAFGQSGAASCENLETLFTKKLAEDPENEALLGQAVALMSRANCQSDFFFATAEKYYEIKPSSETALFLAQGFQAREEFEKAMKYLS